jgi:hypothetical protein
MSEPLLQVRYEKRLKSLCMFAIYAILFATLLPFDPFPPDRVTLAAEREWNCIRQRGSCRQ